MVQIMGEKIDLVIKMFWTLICLYAKHEIESHFHRSKHKNQFLVTLIIKDVILYF